MFGCEWRVFEDAGPTEMVVGESKRLGVTACCRRMVLWGSGLSHILLKKR